MKIFIAGPRAVTKLSSDVTMRLENIIKNNFVVLVGDANGVDKAIQNYYNEKGYKNVVVYATGERIRNNIGNWGTNKVETTGNAKGFDFYTIKDKQMARDADYGLMIWNGKSKGTFNNIINLVKLNKTVLLYLIPNKQFYKVENISDIERLVKSINNNDINKFFLDKSTDVEQMRLEM